MSRDCPLCGSSLADDANECTTCGERFEGAGTAQNAEVECPSCMSLVPASVESCPICGEKLEVAVAESTAVPEPTLEAAPSGSEQATRECPECGSITDAEAIECAICGFKFEYEGLDLPVQDQTPAPEPEMAPTPIVPVPVAEKPEPKVEKASKKKKKQKPEPPVVEEKTVKCPACKETIKAGDAACPLCGAILSEYLVICPACRAQVPAIDEICPECFATLGEQSVEAAPTMGVESLPVIPESDIDYVKCATPTEVVADTAEGRECLVCFAILGEGDYNCPVCKLPFGTRLPPEEEVEQQWEGIGIEIPKDYFKCPNCEALLTDTEPTDCEVAERKWFMRAIIFLFTGIFVSSISIWVRGVTVEMQEQGLSPTPMDIVVNTIGWILVVMGFIFWFFSWRAAGRAKMCPQCGCEVKHDAENCPECGECFDMLQEQGLNGAENDAGEKA